MPTIATRPRNRSHMRQTLATCAVSSTLMLTACGGGGGSSNSGGPENSDNDTRTGVFLDSAVANIRYETDTQSGTTNPDGEFEYVAGETVTFKIGDLALPSATASEVVTPLSLAGTSDLSDTRVTNIARLLQSLDKDDNPDNGIVLDDKAHDSATGADAADEVDFSASDFENDEFVANLVANSGSPRTVLVSEQDAQEHLAPQSVRDTWLIDDQNIALALLPDGTFYWMEGEGTEPNGLDWGEYTIDEVNREVSFVRQFTTNPDGGIDSERVTADFTVDATSLVLNGIDLDRAASGSELPGTWKGAGNPSTSLLILTESGGFLYAENSASTSPNGLEAGTYAYDAGTGELTFTADYDDIRDSTGGADDAGLIAQDSSGQNQEQTVEVTSIDSTSLVLTAGDSTFRWQRQ